MAPPGNQIQVSSSAPKLLDQLRERIRYMHYSMKTEKAYVLWVRAFIRFHEMQHPAEMGRPEVEQFLSHLVAERRVSTSTHRQALSALLFLFLARLLYGTGSRIAEALQLLGRIWISSGSRSSFGLAKATRTGQ